MNARATWLRDGLSLCNVMVNLSLVDLDLLLPVVTLCAFGTVGLSRLIFDLARLTSLALRSQVVQLRIVRGQAPVRRRRVNATCASEPDWFQRGASLLGITAGSLGN